MLVGTMLSVAGFSVLALTASYPLYLIAFGLFLGPGMAVGVILPATLVTRWYVVNRGRALGIVCAPSVIVLVPLVSTWMLQSMACRRPMRCSPPVRGERDCQPLHR